jgi:molecular chaperone DnaJ
VAKSDYYEVLGISRTADEQEIKHAFHREALRWHPDRNPGDPAAEEHFRAAAEAYEALRHPKTNPSGFGRGGRRRGGFGRGCGGRCGRRSGSEE